MFIGDQVLLDASYGEARRRLAWLAGSQVLGWACEAAYGEGVTGLVAGAGAGGAARLAGVRAGAVTADGSGACLPLRWEAIGADGSLFAALDADLTLRPAGEQTTVLAITAVYRLPSLAGSRPDRLVAGGAAAATSPWLPGPRRLHPGPSGDGRRAAAARGQPCCRDQRGPR